MTRVYQTGLQIFTAANAGVNHNSYDPTDAAMYGRAIDIGQLAYVSFHVVWSGLTGTINATVQVYASGRPNLPWAAKDAAILPISGSSGTSLISLSGVIPEPYIAVSYVAGTVTGGTIDIYISGK